MYETICRLSTPKSNTSIPTKRELQPSFNGEKIIWEMTENRRGLIFKGLQNFYR